QYDRVREMASSGFGRFGGFPGTGGPGTGGPGRVRVEGAPFDFGGRAGDVGDLGDLFSGLFGGRGARGPTQPARGADLETEVRVSFEDAMAGTTMPVQIRGPAPCQRCRGSGAEPGTPVATCPRCAGTGTETVNQGLFQMTRTCGNCRGSGRIVEKPCRDCAGSGVRHTTRRLQVKVPAGVQDGARIRLAGRGEPGGPGGRPGDLYVVVRVRPHALFGRRGADLTLELPVTYSEAALGAHVEVPTLNGAVTLKIPAGTAPGRTFRLRGKGAPRTRGGHGDLLVTVRVHVPQKLSREERDLLEKLQEAQKESPRARLGPEA
ncbi:MAG: molecular chaperone DnaJ, partial [Actinobacteria bacterium]|nr:molecular chaperone DnaJ [Actinomycetota bacterium]